MIQGVVNRFEAIHDRREAEIHGRGANRKLDGKWYVTRTIISDDGQETRENGAQLCQRFFTGYGYDRSEIGVTNERSSSFLIEFTRFPLNNSGAKGARERAEWKSGRRSVSTVEYNRAAWCSISRDGRAPHEAGILLHEFSSRVWSMGGAVVHEVGSNPARS